VEFCHRLGIPASGRKLEILSRIEVYLKTGKVLRPERIILGAPKSNSTTQSEGRHQALTLTAPVVNFKSDQRTRVFFISVIGPQFHFTAHLNQFMRGRHDLTYGDLVKEWLAERDRRKDKSYKPRIMKSGEYNQFIRDFFTDPNNRGKKLIDAVSSWERVKKLPGPRVYSRSRNPKSKLRRAPLKLEKFKGELLGGHKGAAVEVPFDPAKRWAIAPTRLRPGRWGYHVEGSLNGTSLKSVIVERARKFWLLVDDDLQLASGVSLGDTVHIALIPLTQR